MQRRSKEPAAPKVSRGGVGGRIGVLVIAAVILIAAFAVLRPGDEREERPAAAAVPLTTTPTQAVRPATTQAAPEPARTTRATPPTPLLRAGRVRSLKVKAGETVRFAARSDTDDEIHVHGYDISREAPAGDTVQMSFRARLEGIYEVEFEQAGEPIAELEVRP